MSNEPSMKVLVVSAAGRAFEEARRARPVPGAGEVLVRIHASGVNPLDSKIRTGEAAHAKHPFPAVLGMDLAGVVESVGADVEDFAEGDAVYGLTGGVAALQGSLAEFAAVDARLLARKPTNLSLHDAAALPLVVITAWEGLIDRAQTRAGQTVLVHGGAGGVGHVAVQIALALGAKVFATVAPSQADYIRGLGATPIDYTATTVERYVSDCTDGEGFDVVYDTVGGATLDASFNAVRRNGGHVVSCLGWGTHALAPLSFRAATYSGVFTLLPMLTGKGRARHGQILKEAAQLVEAGKLAPRMDARTFDFGSALAAHEEAAHGRASGRIVIDVVASHTGA